MGVLPLQTQAALQSLNTAGCKWDSESEHEEIQKTFKLWLICFAEWTKNNNTINPNTSVLLFFPVLSFHKLFWCDNQSEISCKYVCLPSSLIDLIQKNHDPII